MWGWLLLAFMLSMGVLYARQLWRKIAALASYVVCLLLSDAFRDSERTRFGHWMETANCTQDASVTMQTSMFVLRAAEDFARRGPLAITRAPARCFKQTGSLRRNLRVEAGARERLR